MVRLLFSVAALAFVMVGLLAFTPGFDVSPAGLLIIFAFISVLLLFYISAVKTAAGSYLTGMTLLELVAWVQGYVLIVRRHPVRSSAWRHLSLSGQHQQVSS